MARQATSCDRGMTSSRGSPRAKSPSPQWRIGTEHEKFVFHTDTLTPVPYEGERSISALMEALIARFGWQPIMEGGKIIALKQPDGELCGNISLEPGGQFELSGGAVETLHDTAAETHQHLREVLSVGEPLGIGFLGLGFSPKWTLAETPHMPKERYSIMTRYMPTVGSRGLDMMYRTATIQVNLDFADEADMVKKLRVSLALQPIATALFASSPFTEGSLNGFKSMRSEVWRDTDRRRTGMLPFAFEDGMGYERYVDYALDVPMYFVYRDGRYIDASGGSFQRLPRRQAAAAAGRAADARRLVRPPDDAVPRGAAQALPGDARRRQRTLAAHLRAAGLLGRACCTTRRRSMPPGSWSRTGPRRSARALRNAVPKSALATPFRDDDRAAHRPRGRCASPAAGCAPAGASMPPARTRRSTSTSSMRSPFRAARWPTG